MKTEWSKAAGGLEAIIGCCKRFFFIRSLIQCSLSRILNDKRPGSQREREKEFVNRNQWWNSVTYILLEFIIHLKGIWNRAKSTLNPFPYPEDKCMWQSRIFSWASSLSLLSSSSSLFNILRYWIFMFAWCNPLRKSQNACWWMKMTSCHGCAFHQHVPNHGNRMKAQVSKRTKIFV